MELRSQSHSEENTPLSQSQNEVIQNFILLANENTKQFK